MDNKIQQRRQKKKIKEEKRQKKNKNKQHFIQINQPPHKQQKQNNNKNINNISKITTNTKSISDHINSNKNNDKYKYEQKQKINNQQQLNFNNIVNQQQVQVSFLISQINQNQYHSMKIILQKFAKITGIISSDWADAIINNSIAGNSVLVQDDEQQQQQQQSQQQQQKDKNKNIQKLNDQQNVCNGIINILSYENKLVKKMLQKIIKSIDKKKPTFHGNQNPIQILQNKTCSLLICQRAINLPAFIIKSMHEILINDLKLLHQTNSYSYNKICGNYLFGISEIQIPNNNQNNVGDIQDIVFSKFQDFLFLQKSVCWWVGASSPNSVRKVPLHKLYYIISMEKYFQAVGQIQNLLEQQ